MSEVRETSWNNAESHVLKHFSLELCKMIYKSHLVIMHSLHISGTFTCSPIVKVCVARLAGPSETPQNCTNSWSRFAKEFGSRLNWQTGKYTTSQTGVVFWVMLIQCCIMSWNGMWWNVNRLCPCRAWCLSNSKASEICWKVLEYIEYIIEIQNIIWCSIYIRIFYQTKGKKRRKS